MTRRRLGMHWSDLAVVLVLVGALAGWALHTSSLLSVRRQDYTSAAAWLTSMTARQVGLFDGVSGMQAGLAQVGAGERAVGSVGASVYVVSADRHQSYVELLDQDTMMPSEALHLQVGQTAVGADGLYVLDAVGGAVSFVPPDVPLTAHPVLRQVHVLMQDGDGTVWAYSSARRRLTPLRHGTPGPALTTPRVVTDVRTVGGSIAVIDGTSGQILKATGSRPLRPVAHIDPAYRAADLELSDNEVGGISAVSASRGQLLLAGNGTTRMVDLRAFGVSSEVSRGIVSGGKIYLPDRSTGQVLVADQRTGKALPPLQLGNGHVDPEGFAREGVVWINDLTGSGALAVQEGHALTIAKYHTGRAGPMGQELGPTPSPNTQPRSRVGLSTPSPNSPTSSYSPPPTASSAPTPDPAPSSTPRSSSAAGARPTPSSSPTEGQGKPTGRPTIAPSPTGVPVPGSSGVPSPSPARSGSPEPIDSGHRHGLQMVGTFVAPPDSDLDKTWDFRDINPNGTIAFMTTGDRGLPWLVDINDPAHPNTLSEVDGPQGDGFDALFSRNGQLMVVDTDSPTTIWDVSRPSDPVQLAELPEDFYASSAELLSPDGRLLFVQIDNDSLIWSLENPRKPRLLSTWKNQTVAAMSPDGSLVVTQESRTRSALWRMGRYGPMKKLSSFANQASEIGFSASGQVLVLGGVPAEGQPPQLWDISNPAKPRKSSTLPRDEQGSYHDTSSVQPLLAVSTRNALTLWDISDPERPHIVDSTPQSLQYGPSPVTFSQDGSRLSTSQTIWRVF